MFDGRCPLVLGHTGNVVSRDGQLARRRREGLAPLCTIAGETKPERIVVSDNRRQRASQQSFVQPGRYLQQHRLIEVVRFGEVLFKEPSLDRRQRGIPGDWPLVGPCGRSGGDDIRELGDRLMLEKLLRRQVKARLPGAECADWYATLCSPVDVRREPEAPRS